MRPPVPHDAPINVTHVVFDFDGGGLETLVAELARRFQGSAVRVSVISLSGRAGRLGEATRDRFEQFHVVSPTRGVSMLWPVEVARVIQQTHAHVVHTHNGSWFKAAKAARLAGVKRVIYTEHGREHFDPLRNRVMDRLASRNTDAIAAVSGRLQKYMEDVVRIDPRKLCTIENGVDTATFTPGAPAAEVRASLEIPDGALVIGSVGRLETVKAYDRVLEAAALLRDQLSRPFVVVLAGDGSQREPLRERARQLGIEDIVRFPGWNPQPINFYRLFDVFVVSSLSEGQSVSLMEAMACGAAPVVTDVGGNAEMLGPALTDQVISGSDRIVERIADVIRATAASPKRLDAVSTEVRRRAEECYSLNQMAANYERLYRSSEIPSDLRR